MKQSTDSLLAAIDLGSNSFHMIVARVVDNEVRQVTRLSEKIRLGAALDGQQNLSAAAQEQALVCLKRFAQQIEGIEPARVRIVGTNTLRVARNGFEFCLRAEQVLGTSVEVISGREEARLIYLGVSHALADDGERRLVIDVGGGSTEFILGQCFESTELESLHMGCVSYGLRFFPEGTISKEGFSSAVLAARREVLPISSALRKAGWQQVVGASGTMKSIGQVISANAWSEEGITLDALERARSKLLQVTDCELLDIPGLKDDRRATFAAGVAVLMGIFMQLDLQHVSISDGALREGVLYDMLGRIQHEDVRDRSLQALRVRYHIDSAFADRVSQVASAAFDQVHTTWHLDSASHRELLSRAALMHELGLAISHSQFHKHGAYILRHTDLAGFSKFEQSSLAFLVLNHRRKFALGGLDIFSDSHQQDILYLTVLLRLAVVLCRGRSEKPIPEFKLKASPSAFSLSLQSGWLADHTLTDADLQEEKMLLAKIGFDFNYC